MRLRMFLLRLVAFSCCIAMFVSVSYAQESPAFKAKYKIAESADIRILDDNIWDYSLDTIPPKWKEMGEDPLEKLSETLIRCRTVPGHVYDLYGERVTSHFNVYLGCGYSPKGEYVLLRLEDGCHLYDSKGTALVDMLK